jgi:hypothetical protein
MSVLSNVRSARPRRANLLVGAVTAVLCLVATFGTQVASAAPSPPLPPTATASPGPNGSVVLNWQFPPDPNRTQFLVYVADVTTSQTVGWGTLIVTGGTSTSGVVDWLVPGRHYRFGIVAQGAGATPASATTDATTPPPRGCLVTSPCVGVDTTTSTGNAQRIGNGVLHGITNQTPQALLTPLATTGWRIAPFDSDRYRAARGAGGSITLVLSDAWTINNWAGTSVARNPWDDWTAYANTIKFTVQWQQNSGLAPDYWDIQNEPDNRSYYSSKSPPTRALILQQFQVAYDAIKQVQPNAKIIGPSLGGPIINDTTQLVDMNSFLADAAAHNMHYDAISWHELGGGQAPGVFDGAPRSVAEHVSWIRALLASHPTLGNPPLFVNEYGATWAQGIPGSETGYLAALEASGVSSAIHSCWPVTGPSGWVDTCFDQRGLLDGLISLDGRATPAWWVHREYAAMTGTKAKADGNNPALPAYATRLPSGEIDVLVGHDEGCNPAVDRAYCPSGTAVAPSLTPALTVTVPVGSATAYSMTVQRIPHQPGALDNPVIVGKPVKLTVLLGTVATTLPALPSGDAVFVQLVPTS